MSSFIRTTPKLTSLLMTWQKLVRLGWDVFPNPSCSPDHGLWDFHLLRSLQNSINEKKVYSLEECKKHLRIIIQKDAYSGRCTTYNFMAIQKVFSSRRCSNLRNPQNKFLNNFWYLVIWSRRSFWTLSSREKLRLCNSSLDMTAGL